MPRYQPPMITGGDRRNPTWSELLSYYLPQQQGYESRPQIPMLSDPMATYERYRRPLETAPDRGTRPSPWTAGGSSFEEIMRRLTERRPAIPTRQVPPNVPESSTPQPQQPPQGIDPSAPPEMYMSGLMREMRNLQRY